MKNVFKLLLVLPIALSFGCSRQSAKSTQTKSAKRTIAVIPKGTMHEFWKSVHAGAVKAGEETGCEIIWKGPIKEDDRDAQIAVVEDFISKGVSGIVLAPLDDAALRTPVSNATRSGIPVVIIDSGLQGKDFTSFVATDNRKGGKMGGEELARLLGGKGNVIMLRYNEGSASTTEREKGFLDAMAANKGIKVLSENQYGGATPESAYKASENLLARFKKGGKLEIDGVFCPNESTTFGMLRALQDLDAAGKIKFVGFDASKQLVDGLKAGQIQGLIVQNPMNIGYMGVKAMVDHLDGKKVEARIDTGATLVTKANMDKSEVKDLLEPKLDKWLK
jgi:ribose transport system substrate-binding protein